MDEDPSAEIDIETGWDQIKTRAINVLERYLEEGKLLEVPGATQQQKDGTSSNDQRALFSRADYSHLYKTVYDMCVQRTPHNHSAELYKRYGYSIETFCREKVVPALEGKERKSLLIEMHERWAKHKIYVRWLSRFFSYLDRYYIRLLDALPVENEGYNVFYDTVFFSTKDRLTKAILEQVDLERRGFEIDREIVKSTVAMYHHFECIVPDVYRNFLEGPIIQSTKEYYERLCAGWIQSETFSEYLLKVKNALNSEIERCESYLHPLTAPKSQVIIVKVLLEDTLKTLVEKDTGIQHLLQYEKREDLERTYELFSLVHNGLNELASILKAFVTAKGNELIVEKQQADSPQQSGATRVDTFDLSFVQRLITLHTNYKSMVVACFSNHFVLNKALKEAFEVFLNRDLGKSSLSHVMVSFCDKILKKSGVKLSEENVESQLSHCVDLFGFLSDKDLFADIYKTMLAKRLLYETSASQDAEKFMISQLKMRCGQQFTSKMEGMLTDLGVAADLQRNFGDYLKGKKDSKALTSRIDFSAQLLTTGFWPTYANQDVSLPPEMERCLSTFSQFYKDKHASNNQRRITWVHSFGSVTLQALFERKYDLLCNTYQCCLLLLFNNVRVLPFNVITESLRLDDFIVKKLLASCLMRRINVLCKVKKENTSEKSVSIDDDFEVNQSFISSARRIKIPTPLQEEIHSKERVEEDRSHAIQAAVVRVMKMRKELKHHQLIAEVVAQLQFFHPTSKSIKGNIEQLIQREFLERDSQVPDLYRYLA